MVDIQRSSVIDFRTDAQRSREFGDRDTSSADRRLAVLGFVEAAGNEDLAEQVANSDVAAPFKGEIDTPFDELVFAGC